MEYLSSSKYEGDYAQNYKIITITGQGIMSHRGIREATDWSFTTAVFFGEKPSLISLGIIIHFA